MEIDEDFALFYGIMLGDGCIGMYKVKGCKNKYNYIISIVCNSLDDVPFFDNVVAPLILKLTGKAITYRYRKGSNAICFGFFNKDLFFRLKDIGFPVGKKGPNLIIPKIFFEKGLIKEIVSGFFATDGSLVLTKNPNKYYPRVESKTIHKHLMAQIHSYLIDIGMVGHIYLSKSLPDKRWLNPLQQYRFQFNGRDNLITFRNKIGFINPKHEDRFRTFNNYSDKYDSAIKGILPSEQWKYRIVNLDGASGI